MIKPGICFYHLPIAAIGDLTTQPLGELKPVLTPTYSIEPVTAFDNFDQTLRESGHLLLQSDTTLELLGSQGRMSSPRGPSELAFASDIPEAPLKQALADLSPLRRLLPIGTGELQQAVLALIDDEGKTHCRAYLVHLSTQKGRSAALAMVQGIKGYDSSLELLRTTLQTLGCTPYQGDTLYTQLFATHPRHKATPPLQISADATAFNAANTIISSHLPQARAHEDGIIADHDTEFLHDYRVQLRKIRSVLSLFKGVYDEARTADLKARFSALMAPTGPLRDLDVYLLKKQVYYDLVPSSLHSGLDALYQQLAQQRQAAHLKLASHLRSQRYKREINALVRRFTTPEQLERGPNAELIAQDYASALIWMRYRKICKIASRVGPDTDDTEVHELRIQCKKLRYLMEFFAPVFPATPFKQLLKPLKQLQDNLGRFNDYSVQQESLQTLPLGQHQASVDAAQSVGALIAILHDRQLDERAKVVKNLARFNSPKTQQLFRALFTESEAHA